MCLTWLHLTAAELGRQIERGRINPVELVETFLDQGRRHPLTDRIYARMTAARARAEAASAAARARAGLRRGPLDGVPLSWKDLFDSAGIATEAGSTLLAGRIPTRDAEILQNATLSGLVCLGKTHMSELAYSGLGLNSVTETPPCLNDETAVAGGSSSGAAASVAFGLAPAAIASDTGGSGRIPAAWNDLIGLKTTQGRMPMRGTVPLCRRFDSAGPIARSVEDCALVMAALEGKPAPDLAGSGLGSAKFAVLETVALDRIDQRPALGFVDACTRLARAGARVERLVAPEIAEASDLAPILYDGEAYGVWRERIEASPGRISPLILDRFRRGQDISAADYINAGQRLEELRGVWAGTSAPYDAILMPTVPIMPPSIEQISTDESYYDQQNHLALRNTSIVNLMGGCALTLRTSQPSCGITLMAGPMQEERLLRLGMAADRALGG